MKTKAILMSAGYGSRISRKMPNQCKCTLDIGGISLIRYTVEMLLANGIEVHIVVGFNKHNIFDALNGLDVHYHDNVFYSVTNSLASLWFARDELYGDNIILGNSDVFWEENLLNVLISQDHDNVMLADSSRVEQGDYLFRVENGQVRNFGKGNDCPGANCEYVGLAMVRGEMIPRIKHKLETFIINQQHHLWWEQVMYSMIGDHPIRVADVSEYFWREIDFIEDYEAILEYRKSINKA
jgi:choline kinase